MKVEKNEKIPRLISGLDPKETAECMAAIRIRHFSKGEVIIREGDPCTGLFFLMSGLAALQKYTTGGEVVTLRIASEDSAIGVEYFLKKERTFGYSAEALASGELCTLSRENFVRLMNKYSQLKEKIVVLMAERMEDQNRRIALLAQKSVRQKIAYYFLMETSEDKQQDVMRLPGTKEVVAKYLAMPRPSLSRELSAMQSENLIQISGNVVTVLDRRALLKIVEES